MSAGYESIHFYQKKSRMRNVLLPILYLIGCGWSLFAQPSLNQGRVLPARFCDTIPFEFIQGKMVVRVEIGNRLRKFIVDTGAPCAVFDRLQQELAAPVIYRDTISDAIGGIVEMARIEIEFFQLGQVEFSNIPALVMQEQVGQVLNCWGVEGIIGSNALRNCILQINVRDQYLILTNHCDTLDLANSATVPVHLDQHQSHPFVELTLSSDQVILANFDTGDPEPFTISREDTAIPLERQTARLVDIGYGQMLMSLTESQPEQWFRLFNFDTIAIGTARFLNFTSAPSGEQDYSYIGIGLGAYGILTLDYLNQQFHFQAYDKTRSIKAETYQTEPGFTIHPAKDHYVIGMVWNNSTAARLGLKSGFKLQRIGGVDYSKRTPILDCELIMGRYQRAGHNQFEFLDDAGKLITVLISEK